MSFSSFPLLSSLSISLLLPSSLFFLLSWSTSFSIIGVHYLVLPLNTVNSSCLTVTLTQWYVCVRWSRGGGKKKHTKNEKGNAMSAS